MIKANMMTAYNNLLQAVSNILLFVVVPDAIAICA